MIYPLPKYSSTTTTALVFAQKLYVGAEGVEVDFSVAERCVLAMLKDL
jgi:hypothetical protein